MSSAIVFAGKLLYHLVNLAASLAPVAMNLAIAQPALTVAIVGILAACVILLYAIHKHRNVDCGFQGFDFNFSLSIT